MTDREAVDVDRLAERAERLGLVTPDLQGVEDEEPDEVVVMIQISGGLLGDVGTLRADVPRLRVVVVDEDVAEDDDGESDGVWTETATALEDWARDGDDPLVRASGELPEAVRLGLGLSRPD